MFSLCSKPCGRPPMRQGRRVCARPYARGKLNQRNRSADPMRQHSFSEKNSCHRRPRHKSKDFPEATRWGNPMRRPPMRGPERDFPEPNFQGSKLLCKTLCATLCAREKWLPRHCPVSLSGGPYAATLCARSIILFKETGYVQDESSLQAMICQRSVMTNPTT